jgi:SAM-dependent methyltransferase
MADQASQGFLSPFLRQRRANAVIPFLYGSVLDVGCGTGFLASFVLPECYLGVDLDKDSVDLAKTFHKEHSFSQEMPADSFAYDTVVSMAVIEHVDDPQEFLAKLSKLLKPSEKSRIVLTTPHPSMDWIHSIGAWIGLFSKHASEEHNDLLDCQKLRQIGECVGLKSIRYNRFLLGANQLVVYGLSENIVSHVNLPD